MLLYADDTTLIFAEDDRDFSNLELLNEYFIANDLLMNVRKTQTLLFSNRSNDNLTINYKGNSFVSAENILFSVFMLIGDWTGDVI